MVSENKLDDDRFENLIYVQTTISVFKWYSEPQATSDLTEVLSIIFKVNPVAAQNIFIAKSVRVEGCNSCPMNKKNHIPMLEFCFLFHLKILFACRVFLILQIWSNVE